MKKTINKDRIIWNGGRYESLNDAYLARREYQNKNSGESGGSILVYKNNKIKEY
jgi:hypothetical protein